MLGIFIEPGAGVSCGLVKQNVEAILTCLYRFAIYGDFVFFGIGLGSKLGYDLAVDRYFTCSD